MIQNIAIRLQRLALNNRSITGVLGSLKCPQQNLGLKNSIHTTSIAMLDEPTHFLSYNEKMYPIQKPGEERRPAFVCHQKCHVRYTPKKMQYVAWFVRGLSIDEALKQLSFVEKKGAAIVRETLLEAQKLAVEKHNVEFKSNLWVAESFCTKGLVVKGIRRHARARVGEVRYTFCHYFVRLEEGQPPKDYYKHNLPETSEQLLEDWKNKLRKRKIPQSV